MLGIVRLKGASMDSAVEGNDDRLIGCLQCGIDGSMCDMRAIACLCLPFTCTYMVDLVRMSISTNNPVQHSRTMDAGKLILKTLKAITCYSDESSFRIRYVLDVRMEQFIQPQPVNILVRF